MNLTRNLKHLAMWPAAALLLIVSAEGVQGQDIKKAKTRAEKERLAVDNPAYILQRAGDATDRGIARMNVSNLEVRTFNFGLIGGGEGWSALFYPRQDGSTSSENFYFANAFAIGVEEGPWQANAQVHEGGTYNAVNDGDWEALDGARGGQFSNPPQTYGGYPMVAHSDLPATWPASGWPAPESTQEVWEGTNMWNKWERKADKEAYMEFDDKVAGQDNLGTSSPLGFYVRKRALAYGSNDAVFIQHEVENTSANTYTNVYIGQVADNGSPTTSSFLGYPVWNGMRNLLWNRGQNFDAATGVHYSDDSGGTRNVAFVGHIFLESPTGTMRKDGTGAYVDDPTLVQTRRALIDWSDSISNYEEALYGALSGDISYMALDPTLAEIVWKLSQNGGNPVLLQNSANFWTAIDTTGSDIYFYVSSGPITMAPGDKVNYTIAYVAGPTFDVFISNANKAIKTYQAQFNTSGPPPGSDIVANGVKAGPEGREFDARVHNYEIYYTDSGSVTITWDGQASETVHDAITDDQDFEGYRLFKSIDRGASWGDVQLTDNQGNTLDYVPYRQWDLENGIIGTHPIDGTYIGGDTGIVHSFTDTDVLDGIEYWYALVAYDYAPPEPSYTSARGGDPSVPGVVSVIPGARPNGYVSGSVGGAATSALTPTTLGGNFTPDGTITVDVIDGASVGAATFEITTTSTAAYGFDAYTNTIGITLTRTSGTPAVLFTGILPESALYGNDLLPVSGGLKVTASTLFNGVDPYDRVSLDVGGSDFEVTANPWDIGYGDDWFFPSTVDYTDASDAASQIFSVEMRFDTTATQWAYAYNRGGYDFRAFTQVPLTVWDVTSSPDRQLNFRYTAQTTDPDDFFDIGDDPLGADRHYAQIMASDYSGGAADTAYTTGSMNTFNGSVAPVDVVWTFIPGMATGMTVSDMHGYTVAIGYDVPIGPGLTYQFSTTAPTIDDALVDMDAIRVVPNPYYIFAEWDQTENRRKIQFRNVPANSTVDIYTVSGELVASLDHHGDAAAAVGSKGYSSNRIGTIDWNIWTYEFTEAAFGLYIYVVKTDDGKTKVGKFAIIR